MITLSNGKFCYLFSHYRNMLVIFNKVNTWLSLSLLLLLAVPVCAQDVKLTTCLAKTTTPLAIMECFRGLPYRTDGVLDEYNRWTIWSDQTQEFTTAGLNCSGLVTAISRSLWQQNLPLNRVKRDRLNDSGPNSTRGKDWDFGIDLLLNLTDGLNRQLIPNPYNNTKLDSHLWSALDLRGVDIDSDQFAELLTQLQTNRIYYFVISKPDNRFKGGISFYHVGLMIKDGSTIWMYHATPKGGVYRINLTGKNGINWFKRYYGCTPKGNRYIQLVEVLLNNNPL